MKKGELNQMLASKSNNYFRSTLDTANEYYIHDTQFEAARNIVMQIGCNDARTNHVMLVAKMQGGKTGAMCATVNIINSLRLSADMGVNKFFFLSGMNDCGLKDQTYDRVLHQVNGANIDNTYLSKRSKKNLSYNKYFVLKNSDLLAFDGTLDNSVIFIDEAHYGSNASHVLTKFFTKHNIDWKNNYSLLPRHIYIVSISATPFDELVSDTANVKRMIELKTSSAYVGVSEYLNADSICEADKDDISEGGAIFDYIDDAHERMKENDENGVIFIRTRKFDIINNNEKIANNFDIFEMDSSSSRIEYAELNLKLAKLLEENRMRSAFKALGMPINDKPLIVLIKGAFRAGITLSADFKDIIYMVYDYSLNADTTAQALLGRMCGYRKNKASIHKTIFYLNKKFADMYSIWESDFSNRDNIPSNRTIMEWVDNDYVGTDVEFSSRSCGNFTISLTEDKVREIYLSGKGKKNRKSIVSGYIDNIFAESGNTIDYDYISEVHISGKNHYAASSQKKRFDLFSETSLVFPFRPSKLKEFIEDTNRDYFIREDLGKKCISIVLDATIDDNLNVGGNKRLLIYYVEVGQQRRVANRRGQYKPHKDTSLLN